jgi:hypothetical protein
LAGGFLLSFWLERPGTPARSGKPLTHSPRITPLTVLSCERQNREPAGALRVQRAHACLQILERTKARQRGMETPKAINETQNIQHCRLRPMGKLAPQIAV